MADLHEGHRKRLKERFLTKGFSGFADHNILELILFYSIPRKDTNEIAHRLLKRFGSLSAVFDAHMDELTAVDGVGESTAVLIKMFPEAARAYMNDKVKDGVVLDSSEKAGAYLVPRYVGIQNEVIILICLDAKCKVISCSQIVEGSVNATEVSIRKILETAIRCRATSVIISHNHPSGIAVPSHEDVVTTAKIKKSLEIVGIEFNDHIIVADEDFVSMRDSNMF